MFLIDKMFGSFIAFYYFCTHNKVKSIEMDKLPNDPMILFSTLNMLLRDDYTSLDELCDDMNVDRTHLENKLATAGFEYSRENNKFW